MSGVKSMNKHFDQIDILFMSLIFSYLIVLLIILIVMFIQKNRKPAVVTVTEVEENKEDKIVKDNHFMDDLKKRFANIKWNIKNFKYHKLSFIKGIEFKKNGIMDKKVLSLNELIEDNTVLKVANTDNKKKTNNKVKRNVPKKKGKKKSKKRR